jgi:hypothetical protein
MNLQAIQDGIYDWIFSVTSNVSYVSVGAEQIVWREQAAALPPRPAIGLKLLTGPMRVGSFDDVLNAGDDTNCVVGGQRTISVSIQLYGDQSSTFSLNQLAADLSASLTKATILETLYSKGIAIFDIGDISDISAVEESEFEKRLNFDIVIGVAENVEDQPGFIETVGTIGSSFLKV